LFGLREANAIGTFLLNERFNDMTTGSPPTGGWNSFAPNGLVQIIENPFPEDKSVRIEKFQAPANANQHGISRTFGPFSGKVAFEAKVLMRDTAGFKVCPYIYDSNGAPIISVAFEDGNIKSYVGTTKTTIQSFSINQWYMIRVIVNTAANTYDLWIDGVRKLNNAAVRTTPNSGNLAQTKFYMDSTHFGIFYVDNVRIWELGDFIGAPPMLVFDVRDYGAAGNGSTNDTVAIQNAINACT